MKKTNIILAILIITSAIIAGCSAKSEVIDTSGDVITVFKAANCGCCVGYVAELKKAGFNVKVVEQNDLTPIKEKYKIPRDMQSCHTAFIGNYFVEGHVPIEAVNKLMKEQPSIDGIALPMMPAGSPGMPGKKIEAFEVYSLTNGKSQIYIKI
tara:strand:+ start:341 stop:799 length:459 start_codon:yes stop_codon:yes gene_type:complete